MSAASDIGTPPELAWLPVDKLDVDPSYQRTLDTKASQKLIHKIAEGFRWISFQAILATPKGEGDDRRWLVIDGQHRAAAARERGIVHIPAVVVAEASQAEQASAFVGANKDRVAVSAQALYHARLLAGDPQAITVARLLRAGGVEMLRYPLAANKTPACKTTAISALQYLLRNHPEERVAAALAALGEAFRHQMGGIRSPFIMAAVRFLQEGGSTDELCSALKTVGAKKLEAAGVGLGGQSMVAPMKALLQRAIGRPAPVPVRTAAIPQGTKPRDIRPKAPDPPRPTPKPARSSDDDAIARFLAEKGARIVMSPEQVAAFLRDSGHNCNIRIAQEAKWSAGATKYLDKPECLLDGKTVNVDRLYALANELRAAAGLKPIALPTTVAA